MQCVKYITHALNFVLSTHYHILSRHFWLTCVCLKSNIDHVVEWHAFLDFGGRTTMLPLIHSWQQQRLSEGFYCCHLVQLPQEGPPCTYHTTMLHWSKLWACNIETHWYTIWNSRKDNETWHNPLLVGLLVLALVVFPFPPPY